MRITTMKDFLTKLTDSVLQSLAHKDFVEAISYLRKIEEVLEDSAAYGSGSFEFVVFVLHNLAFCYHQVNNTEESASYLDGCAYNVTSKLKAQSRLTVAAKVQLRVYLSQTFLQLSAVLVGLSKLELAQKRCDSALKQLRALLRLHSRVASGYVTAVKSRSAASLGGKPQVVSFVGCAAPAINRAMVYMDLKAGVRTQRQAPSSESLLTRPCSWADIAQPSSLPVDFWQPAKSVSEVVTLDSVCHVLSLSAAALYLQATIKRALSSPEARKFHRRAVLVAEEMTENALTQMITKTYNSIYPALDVSTESAKSSHSRPSSRSPVRRMPAKSPPKASSIQRARSVAPTSGLKPLPKGLMSFAVASAELDRRLREVQHKALPAL